MAAFVESLGPLAVALRLRHLSDRLQEAGRRVYKSEGLTLESNWFALILLLSKHGSLAITEAAGLLGLSHPSVIDAARRMERIGLITTSDDPADGRKRILALSHECEKLLPEFDTVWQAFGAELGSLMEPSGSRLLGSLESIDAQLDVLDLDKRVEGRLNELRSLESTQTPGAPWHRRNPGNPRSSLNQSAGPVSGRPRVAEISVRPISDTDRDAVLDIARELVRSADTYAFDPDISDNDLWQYWSPPSPSSMARGFVAELPRSTTGETTGEESDSSEGDHNEVVAVFVIKPNHPGPASHVANASYAVRADMRGLGVGRRIGEESIQLAKDLGYAAMQFNIVLTTNTAAVDLWRSLGFRVVGTIADGFRMPDGRLVAHHIMHRGLS